ncbi:hypothetical protein J5N97_016683 [Dioscorea zingiberensis]|uniref:Serine-threonine/tyrosine-protein kinase catalytic domain-containing protein n=1 Tax=Dioscorea zingiberensis TaxID=325984 RepID=A0A9D5HFW2_9LILI|nr:hypothetical protein J5N97_016683 [Dioscorea zingiberensis]
MFSTRVMGTYGYCAPEYALTGQLTTMSDVYSFGVVFLEIITGRRAIDTSRPSSEQNLVEWADPLFKDKKRFVEMVDPLLEGNFPVKDVVTALEYLTVSHNKAADDLEERVPRSLSCANSEDKNMNVTDEEKYTISPQQDEEVCHSSERAYKQQDESNQGGSKELEQQHSDKDRS